MGCPGQARTKPRSKIQPSQQSAEDRRRTEATRRWPPATRCAAAAQTSARPAARSGQASRKTAPSHGASSEHQMAGQCATICTCGGQPSCNFLRGRWPRPAPRWRNAQRPSIAQNSAQPWRIQRASNGRPVCNNLHVWRPTIMQLLARPLATASPSMAQQVAQSTAMHRPPCARPSRKAAATNWSQCAWLRPVSRGNRHFTVGGGRLRLIESTTGSKVPSSACTRRPDEISTNGNSSKSWPEQIPARGGGGDGGGRRRRCEGEEGAAETMQWRLGLGCSVTMIKALSHLN
ncbi:hypothetical protein F511_19891 [Dorcoceras hygrometricum]|uniref:Uncharacterized protein n=1 Tax=Dorcoceras hygrometricum TaxID=472368 RepID=A0A2Z7C1Q2_9LAMI|nr:hypothetical protein F511_19891 [Dorcoceras hygrometricum]